jgi:hypothetical protein
MTTEDKAKAQHTFDQVAAHLIEQGEKSLTAVDDDSEFAHCVYRGPNGLRCAIGFCISNEDYDIRMEEKSLASQINFAPGLTVLDKVGAQYYRNAAFLNLLQLIHDCSSVLEWPESLKDFAKKYDLDDSIVDIMLNAKLPKTIAAVPEAAVSLG